MLTICLHWRIMHHGQMLLLLLLLLLLLAVMMLMATMLWDKARVLFCRRRV